MRRRLPDQLEAGAKVIVEQRYLVILICVSLFSKSLYRAHESAAHDKGLVNLVF